jgi:biotin transport system substrate-specific component
MQTVLAERLTRRADSQWRDLVLILQGSLVIAASAQVAIPLPFTPVPITGQTFGVLLVGMALGSRRGALAVLVYLAEGALGLPVFAEFRGGLAVLLGPTGGYLAGFLPAAWAVGALAERGFDRSLPRTLLAFAIGNVIIYLFGLLWLSRFVPWPGTLAAGITPFLIGDAIKAILAALLLPGAWKLLGSDR